MEDPIKKSQEILREQWIKELDVTLENIKAQTEHFWGGIVGFLFNPLVSWVYRFFLSPDIRDKTVNQIEVLLEAGEKYNGNEQALIDKYFDDFKENDVAYIRCKKKHEKFPQLIEKMKNIFLHRARSTADLIKTNGNSHEELIVNNYKSFEKAHADLKLQLDEAEEQLDFAIDNDLLLVNRIIKSQTVRILKSEIEFRRSLFSESLAEYFNKK